MLDVPDPDLNRVWGYYLLTSTLEVGRTREKIPIDLQTSPLIGNFLLYTMVTL